MTSLARFLWLNLTIINTILNFSPHLLRCGLDYSIRFIVKAFSNSAIVDGMASCHAVRWIFNLSSDKLQHAFVSYP
ncbi:hypothetical protein H9Q73_003199 [Fusarium xylarioides]|nr:hypothetical protein H9Q73_003199 [Fusarium xylarioides]